MIETCLWQMFCETGDLYCYLLYKSALKEKKGRPENSTGDALAFCGVGEHPKFRF